MAYAFERSQNAADVADMFGVPTQEVYSPAQTKKKTGDVEVHPHNQGRKPKRTEEQLEKVRTALAEKSVRRVADLVAELEFPISVWRLGRIVRKYGFRLRHF